jgi:hypothetical protein
MELAVYAVISKEMDEDLCRENIVHFGFFAFFARHNDDEKALQS